MFKAINGWRFIFSLLIIWHHMPIWRPENANFGNTIVTFFFVLSGFLLTLSYRDALLNKSISAKDFIIKRCATIFPLQWLFTILFVICSINVVTYWAIPFHLTLTQSLIPFWEIDFTLNTPSWFLSSIFACYICTPILLKSIRSRKLFTTLFILMLLAWHIFLYMLPETIGRRWLCYISPFARIFDYGMGIILAFYWTEIKTVFWKINDRVSVNTLLEIVAICLMCLCLLKPNIEGVEKITGIGSPLLSAIICVFISIFCWEKGVISRMLSLPIFNKLGAMSIAIYMSHGFILHFANRIADSSLVVYVFITLLIVIAISFIIERYYCRYMKRVILQFCKK